MLTIPCKYPALHSVNTRLKWSLPLIFTLLLVFSYTSPRAADSPALEETQGSLADGYVGTKVPDFTATTTSGKKLSSNNFGGKVLILNMWGLNCGSCLDEMVEFEKIYSEYGELGLRIWSVNTEDISAEEILQGLKKKDLKFSYDLLIDPGLEITKHYTNWFIPVTVIVDREGIVQYYKIGFNKKDAETIRAKVGNLLK